MAKQSEEDPPEIRVLVERKQALDKRCTELRKRGADTLIAHIELMPLQSEIDYARASRESDDYKKIEEHLKRIERELDEAEETLRKEKEKEKHYDIQ